MEKHYDVCGLGNGLLDVIVEVTDEELAALGLEKGSARLLEEAEQSVLLQRFKARQAAYSSGGSVANSVIALSELGGRAAFMCRLGDDEYGRHYGAEFIKLGIDVQAAFQRGVPSGTVLVLVTPDAERTMCAHPGAARGFGVQDLAPHLIGQSKWLLIEGYLFANSEASRLAVAQAIQIAKQNNCRVAITVSEDFIVELFGSSLRAALKQADLVFANEKEACALTGKSDFKQAFSVLKQQVPALVVTAGARGALIRLDGCEAAVKAFPCEPLDLTGAGDMLAGVFLYGLTHGMTAEEAARAGCYMAMRVITQYGARLKGDVRKVFLDYRKADESNL